MRAKPIKLGPSQFHSHRFVELERGPIYKEVKIGVLGQPRTVKQDTGKTRVLAYICLIPSNGKPCGEIYRPKTDKEVV